MKKIIATEKAPKAIGPYSQGVSTGELLFVSGQTPLVPGTGKLVSGGIKEQTRQCLNNVKAILDAGGSSLDKVVKATVLLADMSDFADMNSVYAEFFTQDQPARAAFSVKGLPLGAMVEIEVIALA